MADGQMIVADQRNYTPKSFEEVKAMAHYFAQSGMFGADTAQKAFSLMMIAEAEGMHPARAMQEYNVIQGRPALKAEAMLARYQKAGGTIEYLQRTDKCVKIAFTHATSGTLEVEWTIERASKIKRKGKSLTTGDNWRNYPAQMLSARCVAEGVRASYPACIVGFYAPEELEGVEPRKALPQAEPIEAQLEAIPQEGKKIPDGSVGPVDANGASNKELRANYETLITGMKQTLTTESADSWKAAWEEDIDSLPEDYRTSLLGEFDRHRDSICAAQISVEEIPA